MNIEKIKKLRVPNYTKGEELFNMVSHIVGGGIGLIGSIICIIFAAMHDNMCGIVSSIIFGISVSLLYTMSSVYHGLNPKLTAKKLFRVIDHCSIFVLIAGTYTPILLCTIRKYDPIFAWSIFYIIWSFAIFGIVLNLIDLEKYKKVSMICYILMGWCIILKGNMLVTVFSKSAMALLVMGGISYTIGAVLYGIGRKKKWMHSIFHLACVVGTLLHVLFIIIYVV